MWGEHHPGVLPPLSGWCFSFVWGRVAIPVPCWVRLWVNHPGSLQRPPTGRNHHMTHPRLTPARDYLLGLMAEVYPNTPAIPFGSSPGFHETIPEKATTISYQGPRSGHQFLVMAHDLGGVVQMDFLTTVRPHSATSALTGDRDTDLQIIQLLLGVQDILDKADLG